MEAPESSGGPYAWHNILKGRDVISRGAKWRASSAESIGVWMNAWLPPYDHRRILSPLVEGFEEARMIDLIDPKVRQWDLNLLNGLFNPNEMEMIKSIPLCRAPMEDKLIWPYTSSGQYTSQSRYRFLTHENHNSHIAKYPNSSGEVWKLIWGLSVPNKMRNFMWKACRDSLRVKSNLLKQKIIQSDCCDHCKSALESVLHTLWEYPSISQVWSSLSVFKELHYHLRPHHPRSKGRKECQEAGNSDVDTLVSSKPSASGE